MGEILAFIFDHLQAGYDEVWQSWYDQSDYYYAPSYNYNNPGSGYPNNNAYPPGYIPPQVAKDEPNPEQTNPEQTTPEQTNPEQTNSDKTNSDKTNPDQTNSDKFRQDKFRQVRTTSTNRWFQTRIGCEETPSLEISCSTFAF